MKRWLVLWLTLIPALAVAITTSTQDLRIGQDGSGNPTWKNTGIWPGSFSSLPNSSALGKISESGGNPLWNGGAWPGGSGGTGAFADITGQPTDNTNLSTALNGKVGATTFANYTSFHDKYSDAYNVANSGYGSDFTITGTSNTTVGSGGVIRDYSVTFTGGQGLPPAGSYSTTIRVYLPTSYTDGVNQKWLLLLHGGGKSHTQFIYDGSSYLTQADTFGMVLVAPNGLVTGATPNNIAWLNLPYATRVNRMAEDAEAFVKKTLNLWTYKPGVYGMSLGGWKTLHKMVTRAEDYSAFGASCPPVDFIQWNADDNDAGVGGLDHLFANVASYDTSGIYPTGNPFIDNLWVQNSINKVIGNAKLGNRKLWLAYGDSDPVLNYAHHYTPLVAAIPAANLYTSHLVTSGLHRDYGPDYISELFTFFDNEAKLVSNRLFSTYEVNLLGNNKTKVPHLMGYAGFVSFQPIQTQFVAVNTAPSQGASDGAGATYTSDPGSGGASGDRLGFNLFGGSYDSTHDYKNGVGFEAFRDDAWTSTSTPGYLTIATAPSGSTTRLKRLKIGSDGKVTILNSTGGASLCFEGDGSCMTSAAATAGGSATHVQVNGSGGLYGDADFRFNAGPGIGGTKGVYLGGTNNTVFGVYAPASYGGGRTIVFGIDTNAGYTYFGDTSAAVLPSTGAFRGVGDINITGDFLKNGVAIGGSGTVTSITPGAGFTSATPITTTGTLNIDVGGGANQILQADSSGRFTIGNPDTSLDVLNIGGSSSGLATLYNSATYSSSAGAFLSLVAGNNTAISAADQRLGGISFKGGYNTSHGTTTGASIEAFSDGAFTSTTVMPTYMSFKTAGASGARAERVRVPSDGGIRLLTATEQTCDSTHRGTFNYVAGGAGVKDTVKVCAKDGSDAYAWRTIY